MIVLLAVVMAVVVVALTVGSLFTVRRQRKALAEHPPDDVA